MSAPLVASSVVEASSVAPDVVSPEVGSSSVVVASTGSFSCTFSTAQTALLRFLCSSMARTHHRSFSGLVAHGASVKGVTPVRRPASVSSSPTMIARRFLPRQTVIVSRTRLSSVTR